MIGNGNVRTAIDRQDSSVTGAGNPACQIDPSAFGINILHHQPFGQGVIVHLNNVLKGAFFPVKHDPVTVVDPVHGAALYRNLVTVVFQFCKILRA